MQDTDNTVQELHFDTCTCALEGMRLMVCSHLPFPLTQFKQKTGRFNKTASVNTPLGFHVLAAVLTIEFLNIHSDVFERI